MAGRSLLDAEGALAHFVRDREWLRSLLAGPRMVRRAWLRHHPQSQESDVWALPPTTAADVLKHVSELVVSDLRVRVRDFEGEFVLGPQSHLLTRILLTGVYESKFAQLLLSHIDPDRDVIDVGANVGFYTVLAAKHLNKGRVLAAEPTTAAYARLEENIRFNGVAERVIPFKGLIGATESVGTVNIVPGREEYSSVGDLVHPSIVGETVVRESVPAQSIDALVKQHSLKPAFIKVDVEGGEEAVFDGAEKTLTTFRPIIMSEFAEILMKQNGSTPAGLLAKFDRWGYDVHDALGRNIKPDGVRSSEILAIPRP